MTRRILSCAFAVGLMATPGVAQRGGHNGFPVLAPSSPQRSGFGPRNGHHQQFPGSFFLGTPFWGDDYYPYYPSDQAPPYVVQAPPKPLEYPKSRAPLMIELQGDHYVRRTSDGSIETQPEAVTTTASIARASSAAAGPSSARVNVPQRSNFSPASTPTLSTPSEAPTVFVFRDGHREESSDYSIISGVIYSRGDYWATGSWSKKILIADLDVPATMQANRERSVSFRLPNSPNEVITRP